MKMLTLFAVLLWVCLSCAPARGVETTVEGGTIYPGGAEIAHDAMVILSTVRFGVDNLPPIDENLRYIVKDIKLRIDLDHPWASDVEADLMFNGMTVGLFHDAGFGAEFASSTGAEYWVHDGGEGLPRRGVIPSGTYHPDVGTNDIEDTLQALEGMDPTGVWLLRVADDFAGDDGTFFGWHIELNLEAVPIPEPSAGGWLLVGWLAVVGRRRRGG